VQVYFYSFFNLGARWVWVVNAMPWALYPQEREPVPHSSGAWVCPRAQNLVPHWKCTCNHKYLFCDAPPTRVGPYTPSSGKLSRSNTFIISAAQDVNMYSQNMLSFKILLKCVKCRLHSFFHLLKILCWVANIYVIAGVFILKGIIILEIIKYPKSCSFLHVC